MKQLCPSCLKSVEVPETAAGTDYPCLVCGSLIPVPKNYSPSVAVPPPPAPAERPPPPPGLAPPTGTSTPFTPAMPVGDAKEISVTISPKLIEWLPAICLALAFVLTFFNWTGSYPGGYRLFSQNAWTALFGEISINAVPADLEETERQLDRVTKSNWFLLLYLAMLVVTLFLTWTDRLLPDEIDPLKLPAPLFPLTKIWPMRHGLLLVLCALLLGLFAIQYWKGLGLENAVQGLATAKYEEETKAADTELKKTAAKVKIGQEYAKFAIQTTTWYSISFWVHVVAVAAMFLRLRFKDRAGRPAPRLALRY